MRFSIRGVKECNDSDLRLEKLDSIIQDEDLSRYIL